MTKEMTNQTRPTMESRLVEQYGELIELQELAQLLKYSSTLALKRAINSGKLDIELVKVGSRRVAATRHVSAFLIKAGLPERPGGKGEAC